MTDQGTKPGAGPADVPDRRVGDLEVNQYDDTHGRAWDLQRPAWGVMAAIVASALLGLFGDGPLSSVTVGEPDGPLRLEYDRFGRSQSETLLRVRLAPGAVREGRARLWVGRDLLRG